MNYRSNLIGELRLTRNRLMERAADLLEKDAQRRDNALKLHQPVIDSVSALYPEPLCTCGKVYPCETVNALQVNEE